MLQELAASEVLCDAEQLVLTAAIAQIAFRARHDDMDEVFQIWKEGILTVAQVHRTKTLGLESERLDFYLVAPSRLTLEADWVDSYVVRREALNLIAKDGWPPVPCMENGRFVKAPLQLETYNDILRSILQKLQLPLATSHYCKAALLSSSSYYCVKSWY